MLYVLSIHLALMDILFFLTLSGLHEELTPNGAKNTRSWIHQMFDAICKTCHMKRKVVFKGIFEYITPIHLLFFRLYTDFYINYKRRFHRWKLFVICRDHFLVNLVVFLIAVSLLGKPIKCAQSKLHMLSTQFV